MTTLKIAVAGAGVGSGSHHPQQVQQAGEEEQIPRQIMDRPQQAPVWVDMDDFPNRLVSALELGRIGGGEQSPGAGEDDEGGQ